jgi:hypothetical protein
MLQAGVEKLPHLSRQLRQQSLPLWRIRPSLLAALQASGATVEAGDSITQVFFSSEGIIIKVNGADVQVFEYESVEAMENEASQVAPDGGSIGTTMVTWMDTPHFYKAGRIIALYIGSMALATRNLHEILQTQNKCISKSRAIQIRDIIRLVPIFNPGRTPKRHIYTTNRLFLQEK